MSSTKIDFTKISNLKILVIGDLMLDQFVYGSASRLSPEAPVPILSVNKSCEMLGGAGNATNNLLALDANVILMSVIGHDNNGKKIQKLLESHEKLESYLFVDDTINTITKTRFVNNAHHILRVDVEQPYVLDNDIENAVIEKLLDLSTTHLDAIIISDYNKGMLTPKIKHVLGNMQVPKFLDTKGSINDYGKHIDYITPNIQELGLHTNRIISSPEDMNMAVTTLCKNHNITKVLITAGADGMYLYEAVSSHPETKMPIFQISHQTALNTRPVDISGAGDTVVASFAIGISIGMASEDALEFASKCASIVVGKKGTSVVTIDEIKTMYESVHTVEDFQEKLKEQRVSHKTIGFINGVFDIAHHGHISLFEYAKKHCDYLVVAINSDDSVRQLKGESRPIIDEDNRGKVLSSIKYIDAVIVFYETDPREILKDVRPNIVFKGSDYRDKILIEQDVLNEIGCSITFVDNENSTTEILKRL